MKKQVRRRAQVVSVLLALVPPSIRASTATQTNGSRVLPVIASTKRAARSLHERRNHPSPDGKYVAWLQHGDSDVWDLILTGSRSRRRLVRADNVEALVWVPGHPHRLVVATCGLYGNAQLGLWDGGSRWRTLHSVRDPDEECFTLYGVTADGKTIIYGHDPDLEADHPGRDPIEKRRRLRLPSH